jgi:hypothetical protein
MKTTYLKEDIFILKIGYAILKKKKETSVSLLLFYFIFKCAILKRKNRRSGIGLVYIEL